MHFCVLMGSHGRRDNTMAVTEPFLEELRRGGHTWELIWLCEKRLEPCTACRACQRDWSVFGCVREDDMQEVFDAILRCDVLVLATPIYSWYCTPPMKAVLDRMVYGMNKFYGEERGPALWAGKGLALLVTCGYPPEKGADLWAEGVRRYCRHSSLRYMGMYACPRSRVSAHLYGHQEGGGRRRFRADALRGGVTASPL